MAMLILAFRNFANAPEDKMSCFVLSSAFRAAAVNRNEIMMHCKGKKT